MKTLVDWGWGLAGSDGCNCGFQGDPQGQDPSTSCSSTTARLAPNPSYWPTPSLLGWWAGLEPLTLAGWWFADSCSGGCPAAPRLAGLQWGSACKTQILGKAVLELLQRVGGIGQDGRCTNSISSDDGACAS